jgi:hypothetical protein
LPGGSRGLGDVYKRQQLTRKLGIGTTNRLGKINVPL